MLVPFILMITLALGGIAATYLIADDEPLLWRVAAGNIIGCSVAGTVGFLLACFFGLSSGISAAAVVAGLAPALLFLLPGYRERLKADWRRAKEKLQGADSSKLLTFAYYLFFLILFWIFFNRAMFEMPDGIYTGGSHNLGDLPFHLGAIFSFTEGNDFPPINPSFAGAKFSYPFICDLLTAIFMKLGSGVSEAMFAQNFSWALSLLLVLDRFIVRLANSWIAGKIAAFLLFFCGGLGFIWLFVDYAAQARGFWDFVSMLPHDYTMNDDLSWGNSLITLFITQRSLLFGMPLTLVVLTFIWKTFSKPSSDESAGKTTTSSVLIYGLLAGCLPLIHLHSLFVLFVVVGFLFFFDVRNWKTWVTFGAGVCIVAVPELAWSIQGSASRTSEFIGWHLGWDAKDANLIWFWIKNTGLLFPLLISGLMIVFRNLGKDETPRSDGDGKSTPTIGSDKLLVFYLPFLFCFVLANVAKLAPWEWDNVKVLIYWYVGSIPFICIALIWAWNAGRGFKVVAVACFMILILSGGIDVARTAAGEINTRVFDRDAIGIAEKIKQLTPQRSLFLNAPTYNSAVVLSGRISVMRFPGHLWSHGIDYESRENDVKQIYAGGPAADRLLSKYNIDYVLFSADERSLPNANESYFQKYPVVAEVGQYRVFKIK